MNTSPSICALNILHLEDSLHDHLLVRRELDKTGLAYSITRVDTLAAFEAVIASSPVDLVLADYRLPGFTAVDAWPILQSRNLHPPVILLSGAIGEEAAVSAIQLGFSDYLHKDDIARLERAISRALEIHRALKAKEKADLALAMSEKRLSELTGHLQTAIERERAAIAREIHDDIGGALAAAKLDLAWVSRHSSDSGVDAHIQAATDMLQHALGASQRIMLNLRPSILDQGLLAAVQWLASSFEKRTGIKTTLRSNSDSLCAAKPVQLTAYRTAQEALTNVSKYAQCNLVTIDICDAQDFLTLEITDNGVGITEQEILKPQAFGIRGLQERARAVGGWLDISTKLGVGTSVILSVPLTSTQKVPAEQPFK